MPTRSSSVVSEKPKRVDLEVRRPLPPPLPPPPLLVPVPAEPWPREVVGVESFAGAGGAKVGGSGGGGEGKDIGGVLDFGGGGFSHGGGGIFGGCIFGRGRGGGFGAGVGRVDVFAGEDGERISAFEDDDATEAEQGQDVDGDGDEEGGGGKKGGEGEPLFFLTFGVGGRSGARGADGGCGVGRHGGKNSLLLFGGKSERDSGLAIFDREKREK